jgi:hypothetical protein
MGVVIWGNMMVNVNGVSTAGVAAGVEVCNVMSLMWADLHSPFMAFLVLGS